MDSKKRLFSSGPSGRFGLTLPAGAVLCIFIVVLWWGLNRHEEDTLRKRLKTEAMNLAGLMDNDLSHRIPALKRMAERWEIFGPLTETEFTSDARSYLEDAPGFQALEWVDRDFIVRRVVPLKGNEQALHLNLAFEKERRVALEFAKAMGSQSMTDPVDLVQGGKGFLLYSPVYIRGKFNGFIIAVFLIEEWLDYVFNEDEISDDYIISVFFDNIPVYKQQAAWDDINRRDLTATAGIEVLSHNISISVQPTENYLFENRSHLPLWVTLAVFMLCLLVVIIIFLLQRKKLAERQLEVEQQRLSYILEGTNIGTWEWNVQTGETVFNERWAEIIGYSLAELEPVSIQTWERFAHPDDLEKSGALLEKHFNRELPYYEFEARLKHKNGDWIWVLDRGKVATWTDDGKPLVMSGTHQDITERKLAEMERERLFDELKQALDNIKTLGGLLPICSNCKKIRDDSGYWKQLESYISEHSDAVFSHSLCPDCARLLYPEVYDRVEKKLEGNK